MFVDSHLHLSKEDYNDIDKVIKDAKNSNVEYLIISCCEMKNLEESLEIVKKNENVFLTLGLHPSEINNYTDEDIYKIEQLLKKEKKIIAVGEIGLDYYYGKENKEAQKKLFITQLDIASRLNLPVVIHTREATLDTISILEKYNLKGVIHCFNGSIDTAKKYISMGYKLGIGGVLTFKNSKLHTVIENIDISNIILETDSPYLSPEPFRGRKNEPKNIPIIAKKISEVKNISIDMVGKFTTKNVLDLYNLEKI